MRRPVVLSVAGSDPSGGAGLQADLQVAAMHGVHGAAVPTLLTVQSSTGVREVTPLEPGFFRRSLEAVLTDMRPRAIKVGALASAEVIHALAATLASSGAAVVLDTVIASSSGALFQGREALDAFRRELAPRAALLTPNLVEARLLAESDAADPLALAEACVRRFGVPTLVKGGHAEGEAIDVLGCADGSEHFAGARRPGPSPHGTGCALSMAIACRLALGAPLIEAIREAKIYVTRAIAGAHPVGHGAPFLDFAASVREGI